MKVTELMMAPLNVEPKKAQQQSENELIMQRLCILSFL